ncbi:TonB-linked outer membrane protein, SusC/RagA family [Salegentibacter holothuriorum]|uniref:TonB-linked outer membrane protein, SusC/RagA family n=1 Tax=Salegentibacter holothuriorum TaxID=241145 RepID=A0A1T5E8P9_9FLAO|nr:TonB-dependent receptor [Salegentibacter holothuriorum]SKB80364.1 TonB-linked outer membrane protein, SusC/RagA family [Salegentibacter holothuriorum]
MKTKFNAKLLPLPKGILIFIMRVFILFFCISSFGFNSDELFSQNAKIKIDKSESISAEDAFQLIKLQTDYTFIYPSDLFNKAPKINLKAGVIPAKELLDQCLSLVNYTYEFTDEQVILLKEKNLFFDSGTKTISEQNTITGTVKDSKGMPLPAVNVYVEGTKRGTQTDFDGNYTIEVGQGERLSFQYLGFQKQIISVENQTTINVVLKDDLESLNEVVVVGYGTQKRSDVTGAISSVKSEELNKVVSTNPLDAMQGRVSGVTVTNSTGSPGSAPEISIRGIGTFGNNEPLYIVDGVQADPYFINTNNIESIEILKDAASGAIYGTRAANGVVIITTKKGEEGKPKIEIESSLSVNTPREEMKLLNAQEYISVHRQMYENAGAELPQYVENPSVYDTDWIGETQRTGYLSTNNIRISGGGKNINYSIGGNYADETGLLIGSGFSKKGVNSQVNLDKGKLKVSTNLNYSETYREDYKFSIRETYFISPLIPVFDDERESGFGYRTGDLPDHRNPVGEDHFLENFTKLKYFLGNINFDFEAFENFHIGAGFSLADRQNYTYNFHQPFRVRDVQDIAEREFAFLSEYHSEFRRLNEEYTLRYNFDIDKHSVGLLAGYQRIREPFKSTYAQAEGYKLDDDGNKVPATILDPNFNTLDAFSDGTYSASGSNAEYALVSQFGRINYAFDEKYLLQASLRRDGSSKFGKNNQYGVFPSFALGWKITEENFMENQEVFNFLKLRYSWGQAGNDSALGYYDYVALISQGKSQNDGGYVFGNPQNSYLGSIARDLQNDDLQWETNTSANFGMDFGVFDNKLQGSINYYNSKTEDLLITKEVSPSAGINNPIVNVGAFENQGFEFEANYRNRDNVFKYSVGGTFTTINSEVTKLSNEDQVLYGVGLLFGSDHFVNQTKIGYEPGAFFLPVADGIFQSEQEVQAHSVDGNLIQPNAEPGDIKFADQNGDGVINEKDEVYAGTAIPNYEYSLNLTGEYKGFDLTIFFQGVGGNKIYNGNDFRLLSLDTGRNYRTAALDAWSPTNTNTNVPRAVLNDPNRNNRASTRFLEDGDYLRLKTLQLGYTLAPDVLKNTFVDRARIFVTGQNLLTVTDYSGLDPEVGGSVLSRGVDLNLYPKYKSLITGVQLSF